MITVLSCQQRLEGDLWATAKRTTFPGGRQQYEAHIAHGVRDCGGDVLGHAVEMRLTWANEFSVMLVEVDERAINVPIESPAGRVGVRWFIELAIQTWQRSQEPTDG